MVCLMIPYGVLSLLRQLPRRHCPCLWSPLPFFCPCYLHHPGDLVVMVFWSHSYDTYAWEVGFRLMGVDWLAICQRKWLWLWQAWEGEGELSQLIGISSTSEWWSRRVQYLEGCWSRWQCDPSRLTVGGTCWPPGSCQRFGPGWSLPLATFEILLPYPTRYGGSVSLASVNKFSLKSRKKSWANKTFSSCITYHFLSERQYPLSLTCFPYFCGLNCREYLSSLWVKLLLYLHKFVDMLVLVLGWVPSLGDSALLFRWPLSGIRILNL